MRRLCSAAGVFIASATFAGATDGFFCEIADKTLILAVFGEYSRGRAA